MSEAPTIRYTTSRAYRIHIDGKLIGFAWKQYGAWLNSQSTDVFPTLAAATKAMLETQED
jgi:hypothetical protein